MLAANEAAAETLTEAKIPFLRRAHEDPEPTKLIHFAEFARSLGVEIDQPQSRFALQRVLAQASKRPEAHAIHYGLLRSLKQARYTPEEFGHYALASQHYCHFTSPIRRYPDLHIHRLLLALAAGEKPRSNLDELYALGEQCTKLERRAEAAERDLIRIKLLTHLEKRIGEEFHAVVVGVEDFGLFCRLVELPVDGLLHVSALDEAEPSDDYFYHEAETHSLVSRMRGKRYRLGDRLIVRIARVDVDRRELDLILPHQPVGTRTHPRPSGSPRPSPRNLSPKPSSKRSPKGSKATRKHPKSAGSPTKRKKRKK